MRPLMCLPTGVFLNTIIMSFLLISMNPLLLGSMCKQIIYFNVVVDERHFSNFYKV